MPDAPGSYAAEHPTKHGFGEGIKSVFHEVPVWGWWVAAVGGVLVIYLHNRNQAQTTSAGAATTAADVTAGGTNVDAGDIVGLNNLMVQSEQMTQQQFQTLQAQIAALQAQVTNQGQPVAGTSGGGTTGTGGPTTGPLPPPNPGGGAGMGNPGPFAPGSHVPTIGLLPNDPFYRGPITDQGDKGTLTNVVHPVQVK